MGHLRPLHLPQYPVATPVVLEDCPLPDNAQWEQEGGKDALLCTCMWTSLLRMLRGMRRAAGRGVEASTEEEREDARGTLGCPWERSWADRLPHRAVT